MNDRLNNLADNDRDSPIFCGFNPLIQRYQLIKTTGLFCQTLLPNEMSSKIPEYLLARLSV